MEKMNITNQEHDAFVKSHPNGDLQLSKWADTKKLTGWYSRHELRLVKMVKLKVWTITIQKYLNYHSLYAIYQEVL